MYYGLPSLRGKRNLISEVSRCLRSVLKLWLSPSSPTALSGHCVAPELPELLPTVFVVPVLCAILCVAVHAMIVYGCL